MTSGTVGNYRLVEKLGEGGMGAVYKGVDLMVEREVAIKMLRPEIARQPEVVERFRAEAVALAKLNHPNIATLYSFFREGDEFFMVMEFVLGRTLETVIRESPAIPVEQATAIASQVLDAIEHAHSYGILHRDIKPANIMLTASGQAKVTDFGIARVLGTARMTREGCVCGTLQYLAPERIRGQEADLRSDLYSMGVVLYEMLSRRLPFERDTEYELMRAHLEETPPRLSSLGLLAIPPPVEMAVAKALAKRPEERFGTAGEFRRALTGAPSRQAAEPAWLPAAPTPVEPAPLPIQADTSADKSPTGTSAGTEPKRRWKLYVGAAAVLVLIGLILAFSWSRKYRALEATHPTAPPPAVQPSQSAVEAPAGSQPGAAGASDTAAPRPETPDVSKDAPTAQGQVAGSAAAGTRKTKSPGPVAPELERRKAALKALEKGEPGKTDKGRDRRSSSLDALKQ